MYLLLLALAPAVILMVYVYFRDKYEKEPIGFILKGVFLGALVIFPVGMVENYLLAFGNGLSGLSKAAFTGFFVAGPVEEVFKFMMVYILIWRNRNFNEKFDGIVYSVSVALGFATIENLFYVFSNNSMQVGFLRAFTAVPGHAIFGVVMGFYLGMAKFSKPGSSKWLSLAIALPWLMHGIYDALVLSGNPLLLILFVPFLIYMYRYGLKCMKAFNEQSVFNPNNMRFIENQDENPFHPTNPNN